MKTVRDFDLKGKRVLVRCDFNVPQNEQGEIEDTFRIKQTLPTIQYLKDNGAKVVLMSHLGDPKGEKDLKFSLAPVGKKLEEYLGCDIKMADDCVGDDLREEILKMNDGEIMLLENLRFYAEEEKNDTEFSRKLSQLADIYINDAFGTCHRKHASVYGITNYLPSGAGLLLEKEIKVLGKVLSSPQRPLVAIIGGAKISSKAVLIKQFLDNADNVILGGKIANTILILKNILTGRSIPADEDLEEIKQIDLTSTKLHLPIDVVASANLKGDAGLHESAPGSVRPDEMVLDIGPETIAMFSKIIGEAKMIVWAGPMGLFENKHFEAGTRDIALAIANNTNAYKIVGGGDTLNAISKYNLLDKFDHISTGGSATLNFLSNEKLPGIEALNKE
jgi:3-phosphoglycerate kinase